MALKFFRRVLSGYSSILKPIAFILGMLAVSAALSLAIAWPLWKFATGSPLIYSLLTLAGIAGTAVFIAVGSRRRASRSADASAPGRRKHPLLFVLFAAAWVLVLCAGVYAAALLSFRGMAAVGIPSLIALVLLLGWAAWAARRKK